MEVILIEDVKNLGKKGDVVKVSDGYARNFILPKKLGIEATKQNLHDLKLQKQAEEKRQKELLEEARQLASHLVAVKVNLTLRPVRVEKLSGQFHKGIANALNEQAGFNLDRKKIQLSEPIKVREHLL